LRKITRDQYGVIGQIQTGGWVEGGDSACWNGHYSYFSGDTKTLPYVKTFEVKPGAYVRHPKADVTYNGFGAYYRNPWMGCISRDQMTGVLLGIIAEKNRMAMLRLFLHWSLKGFLLTYKVLDNGKDPKDGHSEKTGYHIMLFLEEFPEYLPKEIILVTSNPVGKVRMQQAIDSLKKRKLL